MGAKVNYSRHRKYEIEFKKLVEKNLSELNKVSGAQRQKIEDLLKEQAKNIAYGNPELKEEASKEISKKVSKKVSKKAE